MESNITIINKNEGEYLGIAGGNYRIIISGEQTSGNYAVIEMTVPPGGGPPPHAHPDIQEMFHVLDGEVEFKTENGKQIVSKDGFVNIPLGGAIHCFKNTSEKPARLLCTVVPAGLENLFQEIGTTVLPGQTLPIPELTAERKAFLKAMDLKYNQQTYPKDFLG
ncbi:cupin domain-containing protein [Pedobacter sp. ISL-68]|uniref:cupin domain-containing protein n=1 Tax=unclassified Pedobacter TaxID=2628915 RepID=UPI001BE66B89|nr:MULTISPECIES: cupin domain-containing protein [unclassified Pedobacter]MBT2563058.1 cupin domain-containing protein [Pedobacter sp. ISL-64]MBT2593062.1 cupin domain-containing protein [Pedobacter sp. ISL-68]